MNLLRTFFALVILALPVAAGGAMAGEPRFRTSPVAVVELFTSQGCTRCPEADALLARLGARGDIVALAYHIDYWDYAGWEDTFAQPANTRLQQAYAASWGKNRVYTPQMVINGQHGVVGSQETEVHGALAAGQLPVDIALEPGGSDMVRISAQGRAGQMPAIVWMVTYRAGAEVRIERGENSGRVLSYSHIVGARQPIGMWSPSSGASITIPLNASLGDADAAAILIQEKKGDLPGRILGAAVISR